MKFFNSLIFFFFFTSCDSLNTLSIYDKEEKNIDPYEAFEFKDIFSEIVTSVGSSVRSSEITKNAAEGMRDAAVEGDCLTQALILMRKQLH